MSSSRGSFPALSSSEFVVLIQSISGASSHHEVMLCVQNIKNNKMVYCCLKRRAFIFLKKKKSNSSGVGWRGVGHCGVGALFCSQAGLIQKVSALRWPGNLQAKMHPSVHAPRPGGDDEHV